MATNMYIEFTPALKTEVTVDGHKNHIEIMGWNHGFSQPTSPVRSSAGAGTVEQANHMNLSFTKYLDGSTTDVLKKCWAGEQFDTAKVHCYRASKENKPVKYLEVEMKHVIIANYSISGGPGDIPVENVSLDYGVLTYKYLPQKRADGGGGGAKPCTHDLETRKIS